MTSRKESASCIMRKITEGDLSEWESFLTQMEMSSATIQKYTHDVHRFLEYAQGTKVTKDTVLEYKAHLKENAYAARSVNSMLISLNRFFAYKGWDELRVKTDRIQERTFYDEDKEITKAEYDRLVKEAVRKGDDRLEHLLQTICGTGIRIGEVKFITVEAVAAGKAIVSSKGKTREVFFVKKLKRKLLAYIKQHHIESGPVFVTRSGKPISRSNIWRAMKALCEGADVDPAKVYPHNLRHLFARVFYAIHKDIAKLADILGHSNIETTRIYIMSTGAEHRKCMEMMRLIM